MSIVPLAPRKIAQFESPDVKIEQAMLEEGWRAKTGEWSRVSGLKLGGWL